MLIPTAVDRPYYRTPYVTYSIIGICTAVEVARIGVGSWIDLNLAFGYMSQFPSILTLFTHMFLHGGVFHLLGNMIFFYVTAVKVEDALGRWRFILLYLGCGIAASGVEHFFSGISPVPTIGASGAVAGVMGAYAMLYPHSKVKMFYWFFIIYGTVRVRSWIFLGYWVLKEAFSLFFVGEGAGIAFGAHVGGFAAGFLWCWAFYGWDAGERLDHENADVVYAA